MSQCKSCSAEVIWVKNYKTGKDQIVDAKPVKVWIANGFGDNYRLVDGYVPHWAICPDAEKWKRK